ncbi:uncharacterized protein LOC127842847 [Dreissena polymorpha]|uniref:uncharacterized protein LOC127842847 n=1 Tax=Dreissena polymorpha TaxID=45954 RepID=UPI0022655560|nr:uncharacterized protein LOC127842847 [Dreissena polymorpha]
MDLRVLCVFVAVAYVNVIARIMCNFQPRSWTLAMQLCLSLSGTPVSFRSVPSLISCFLNGSFWTSDYATWIATTDSPVDCEYRTLAEDNQFSESTFGNCSEIRHYICCNNTMIESCVKNGTWKEASKCNETYPTPPAQLTMGDYWLRRAYRYQIDTFTVSVQRVLILRRKFNYITSFKHECVVHLKVEFRTALTDVGCWALMETLSLSVELTVQIRSIPFVKLRITPEVNFQCADQLL